MSRKRFTALIAAMSIVAACAAPPSQNTTPSTTPSAQLGTVPPAYPLSDLEDGIEVLESIPVTDLSTDKPIPFADTSVRELCPVARQVATNLLDHIDNQKPGWRERDTHPTE